MKKTLTITLEIEQETDGRWLASVSELLGTMCYGRTEQEAIVEVLYLAGRVVADRLGHDEPILP